MNPIYIKLEDLTEKEKDYLIKSKYFCILPWIHTHVFPDGRAYPCCLADMSQPIGSVKENTLEELWNSEKFRKMRQNMMEDKPSFQCRRCYEQEGSGFHSMRNSANQNFGHHIKDLKHTDEDGTHNEFKIKYYDIRFSNLCNLACRSCGDIFSSNWSKEAKKMGWKDKNDPNVIYAGRYETDMWEQLKPHLPYVEQIYFAGGEPLIMEEHYNILKELLDQERTDVRLIYNTNFTELTFKKQSVLELWKHFDCVAIGASLDASYERGEYMRYGTKWQQIIKNREEMLKVCPEIDFYVSSTLSVMNSFHLPDFHREWVKLGLISPKDWDVNILQEPVYFRLDILPEYLKRKLEEKYKEHIEWLEPQDDVSRATNGYKSSINYMWKKDNSHIISSFLDKSRFMDKHRDQDLFTTFPELGDLKKYEAK